MKWNSDGGTVKLEQESGIVVVEQSGGTEKWNSNGGIIKVEQ